MLGLKRRLFAVYFYAVATMLALIDPDATDNFVRHELNEKYMEKIP